MIKRKFHVIVLSVVFLSQTYTAPYVGATSLKIDESLNDIIILGKDSCTSGGASSLVGNDNLEKILRFYVGKGLSLAQAAGIAGNFKAESGFNPAVIEGGAIAPDDYTPVNGVGFGLAQWTFSGRQQPLMELAKSTNRKVTDLSLQLDYSWQEMEGGTGKFSLEEYKQITEPDEAAYIFHRDFEVSADSREAIQDNRMNPAKEIYEAFKSIIKESGSSGTSSASATCSGDGSASDFLDDNSFVIYDQCDPQWGNMIYGGSDTICQTGCGPASMAMIITALTGQTVTPADTAKVARDKGIHIPGVGSSWDISPVLSEHWGLTATQLTNDVAQINEALRGGALINVSGAGPSPFADVGHFITIRGVTASGKWKIGNSSGSQGREESKQEWDPATLASMMRPANVYAISKK